MRGTYVFATVVGVLSLGITAQSTNTTSGNETSSDPVHRCGTDTTSPEFIELSRQMDEQESNNGTDVNAEALSQITVDTWFHVVATGRTFAQGWVSDADVNFQLKVMNNRYAAHKIQFKKAGITRTVNKNWANNPTDAQEKKMYQKLRKGSYKTLNVYIQKAVSTKGVAGVCSLPVKGVSQNNPPIGDGCHINSDTMPKDGNPTASRMGTALVHEVGHWFGLLHTFQENGNCQTGTGDLVKDTPVHLQVAVGWDQCGKTFNSCPSLPGNDPTSNYMNYVPDICQKKFTTGQQTRMRNMWKSLRA